MGKFVKSPGISGKKKSEKKSEKTEKSSKKDGLACSVSHNKSYL